MTSWSYVVQSRCSFCSRTSSQNGIKCRSWWCCRASRCPLYLSHASVEVHTASSFTSERQGNAVVKPLCLYLSVFFVLFWYRVQAWFYKIAHCGVQLHYFPEWRTLRGGNDDNSVKTIESSLAFHPLHGPTALFGVKFQPCTWNIYFLSLGQFLMNYYQRPMVTGSECQDIYFFPNYFRKICPKPDLYNRHYNP